MPDDIDRAQELEQIQRQDALDKIYHGHEAPVDWETASAKWCEAVGCGERIPDARRQAVPGCRFCADCQGRMEQIKRGFR